MYRLPSNKLKKIVLFFCAMPFFFLRMQAQQSPHGPLSITCTDCHTTASWKELATPMRFNHSTTAFALQGQHSNVACLQCHTTKIFSGTPTACFACHQKDFTKALVPNHQLGKFSHDCAACHTLNGWQPSLFQHAKTNFQLVGAHQSIDCATCHTGNRFAGLPSDCYSCHQQIYNQTTTPNHRTAQFNHDCLNCHNTNNWKPSSFDHKKTNFQLVGAHVVVECSSCHKNGQFKGLRTDCFTCHLQNFSKTTSPNHTTAQFSHECLSCHTHTSWKPSTFDHAKTNFKLSGAHVSVECASCHVSGHFKGTANDCFTCHQQAFAKTLMPDHQAAKLSHECLSCHSINVWKPSTFDHNKTDFQLLGAHKTADCSSCHHRGQYNGLPLDCYSCHQSAYIKAFNPNHAIAQFSHDCTTCHSMNLWKPATFDHNKTNFQLVGAHKTTDCSLCHKNGQYKGLATDCFTCHQQDFSKTTTPNHTTAQFSHDCMTCHSMNSWKPATFDHNKTNFQLVGAHKTTDCLFCHKNGQYKGTPSDCYLCHITNFNGVTDPNHVTGNFDHNCSACHTTTAWKPATFDHNKTNFKLTGAHVQTLCTKCHVGGKYAGTSSDCYTCHGTDYNNSINPNHATAKYPTDCNSCHTTAAWKPSTFDHTPFFPINSSAKHRPGRWNLCSDCHTNPTSAKVFSCITCHEHNKTEMDKEHSGKSGYSYDSNACYRCHPQGR